MVSASSFGPPSAEAGASLSPALLSHSIEASLTPAIARDAIGRCGRKRPAALWLGGSDMARVAAIAAVLLFGFWGSDTKSATVDVSYNVSGSPGNWLYSFSISNNTPPAPRTHEPEVY